MVKKKELNTPKNSKHEGQLLYIYIYIFFAFSPSDFGMWWL